MIDWYCDACDAQLNLQPGFNTYSGSWTCTKCGYLNDVTEDNVLSEEEDEFELSLQQECPKCGGHMARSFVHVGNVWVCESCGAEAEEDGYGLLWS